MRFDVQMWFGTRVDYETVQKLYWLADVRGVEKRLCDANTHALFHTGGNNLPRVIAEYVVDGEQKPNRWKYNKAWMILPSPLQLGCVSPHGEVLPEEQVYVLYFPLEPNGYAGDEFQLTAAFLQGFFAALDVTPLRQLFHDLGVQYIEPTLQSFADVT